MDKKNIFLILLILGTGFWGISFSVTKLAIGHASSSTFLFYRFLAAAAVLSLIFSRHLKMITRQTVKTGISLAVPLTLGIYLQTLGIKHSSASQCSFVAGTCVIIIPMLKAVFYNTVAPAKIWIAAVVALIGLSIISVNDNFSVSIGDLYTIAGALGFAVYLIQVEKHSTSQHIAYTIVPMFIACAAITGCIALTDSNANWLPQNNQFWMGIAYCALFSTAFMYTISNISQRYLSAERVAIIYLFEPVFGAIAACFILGEHLTWRLFIGGSLIFAATLISELKFSTKTVVLEANPVE
jgi:drug/metabolite transporter (DMT)-like permease